MRRERRNGKKKDEKRSKRGKERRGPYIARLLAEPEIDLGKNPPVASSLSHLHAPSPSTLPPPRRAVDDGRRCWPLPATAANPRLCFCFRKKGPSPSARPVRSCS